MKNRNYTLILIIAMLFASAFSFAQRKKSSSSSPATTKTTGMKKHEGYFNFYYDGKRDKIFLLIDKLDQEFLYVNSLTAGIGSNDIGLDRGQLGGRKVVKFNRLREDDVRFAMYELHGNVHHICPYCEQQFTEFSGRSPLETRF